MFKGVLWRLPMFRTQEMVVGAKLTTQFLLVPKENFEKQGPKLSLRKWVVEVDDLIKEYNVPDCVDLTEVFVFYHNCPNQHELGIRVKPLELYQNLYNKTKFKPNKQSAPPDVDNENKKARITTDNDTACKFLLYAVELRATTKVALRRPRFPRPPSRVPFPSLSAPPELRYHR